MPPKWARRDFDADYEGYLEPNQSDIGDETPTFEFLWIEEFVAKNASKHNVSSQEIVEVFHNQPRETDRRKGHVPGEDKVVVLGRTDAGRYLLVAYISKADNVLMPVSARDMERNERHRYERLKKSK